MTGMRQAGHVALLEREHQMEAARAALTHAKGGAGSVVAIAGQAGIGKTALIGAVSGMAREQGLELLAARGDPLEQDLPFGIVRQLLTGRLAGMTDGERDSLLVGPAALAPRVLDLDEPLESASALAAALHGLHWLCARLADRRPLLLVVDDAHWADIPSLRFCTYLGGRLSELPLLLLVAFRPREPGAAHELLDALSDRALCLSLTTLSRQATSTLVHQRLADADDALLTACHDRTGGNPFLLNELLGAISDHDVERVLPAVAPRSVARAVLVRLARMPPSCGELARAIAVFPSGSSRANVARLAGLDDDTAAAALDELVAAGIIVAGRRLEYLHPLMRSAVHDDLPPAARARAHAKAADILIDEGAEPETVAAQLVLTDPAGDDRWAEMLVHAARRALGVGAAEAAVRYATRALEEPATGGLQAAALRALGEAQILLGDESGSDALGRAGEVAVSARERAAIAVQRGQSLGLMGRREEAVAVIDGAIGEVADSDPDLALAYEAQALWIEWGDEDKPTAYRERLNRLPRDLPGDTLGQQLVLPFQAFAVGLDLGPHEHAVELARRALAGGRLIRAGLQAAPQITFATTILAGAGHVEEARAATRAALESFRRAGALVAVPPAHADLAYQALLAGQLGEAEDEATRAVAAAEHQSSGHVGRAAARSALASVLAAQGRVEEAARALPTGSIRIVTSLSAQLLMARAHVHNLRGCHDAALEDLRPVFGWASRRGFTDAIDVLSWRAREEMVHVLLSRDRHDAARGLADAVLADARRYGASPKIGAALRLRALTSRGEEAIAFAREAVELLTASEHRLDHIRALLTLGSALRRSNQRVVARDVLREALDLARRCGAHGIADRAVEELRASGARLRREALSGIDALTPSELRVARLAAAGRTNRAIANELFVSISTIEMHMSNVLRKLDIASRAQLRVLPELTGS